MRGRNLGFYGIVPELIAMLVDKTKFNLVLCNLANFNRFEKSSYWSVKRISVFLCFSLVNQQHTSAVTVFNHTVTNMCVGHA